MIFCGLETDVEAETVIGFKVFFVDIAEFIKQPKVSCEIESRTEVRAPCEVNPVRNVGRVYETGHGAKLRCCVHINNRKRRTDDGWQQMCLGVCSGIKEVHNAVGIKTVGERCAHFEPVIQSVFYIQRWTQIPQTVIMVEIHGPIHFHDGHVHIELVADVGEIRLLCRLLRHAAKACKQEQK